MLETATSFSRVMPAVNEAQSHPRAAGRAAEDATDGVGNRACRYGAELDFRFAHQLDIDDRHGGYAECSMSVGMVTHGCLRCSYTENLGAETADQQKHRLAPQ